MSDTNRAVRRQKIAKAARGLKFLIKEVEGLYYLCSKNKGAQLICAFVLAYAKSRFSMTRQLIYVFYGGLKI